LYLYVSSVSVYGLKIKIKKLVRLAALLEDYFDLDSLIHGLLTRFPWMSSGSWRSLYGIWIWGL